MNPGTHNTENPRRNQKQIVGRTHHTTNTRPVLPVEPSGYTRFLPVPPPDSRPVNADSPHGDKE